MYRLILLFPFCFRETISPSLDDDPDSSEEQEDADDESMSDA
jgi:hypothetical protein